MTRSSAYKLAAFAGFVVASTPALSADPPPPPEVQQLFVFAGAWRGKLELVQPGQPAQTLDFQFDCKAVEAAWAVTCSAVEKGADGTTTEADVLGYDPNDKLVHFFTVDNAGETHDHKGRWTSADTLALEHTGTLEGKPLAEKLTIVFRGRELTAEFVGTAGGAEIYRGKISAKK
jgi:hypothetical protein